MLSLSHQTSEMPQFRVNKAVIKVLLTKSLMQLLSVRLFSDRWIENLSMAIDYVDIEIEDAIVSFTLTQIMESCYDADTFPNDFCGKVHPRRRRAVTTGKRF